MRVGVHREADLTVAEDTHDRPVHNAVLRQPLR
jgi:hypothetical protein